MTPPKDVSSNALSALLSTETMLPALACRNAPPIRLETTTPDYAWGSASSGLLSTEWSSTPLPKM